MSEVVEILTQAVQESQEAISIEATGAGPSGPTQPPSPKQLKKKTIAEPARPMSPLAQGHQQCIEEVQFLGVLEHPNLVKLLGYWATDGERGIQHLLVYEYMQNRSLEDHLFNKAVPVIPWRTRLKIILGAAQGMAYLHEGLEVQGIYRDFNSSNVLLDENIFDNGKVTSG